MAIKVGMVSLGCAKNQVDGEVLMASLKNAGFETVDDAAMADIAIVNTCGFIESAKKESIEEILELAQLKKEGKIKKLVVTGCLAERYQQEMHKELPELDAVLGIGANGDIAQNLKKMMEEDSFVESFPEKSKMPLCGQRELTTPSYFAYVKIAEGCDNRCSYCAIPLIRGGYRSRTMESIEEECRDLVKNGAKELILIAQDTSRYGIDLYGKYSLAALMERLCKIDGLHWLRVLYCYPDSITDELLELMAREEKIVPYIDLPLQHASGRILKAMNRHYDREIYLDEVRRLKALIPDIVLTSDIIVGFPGETQEEFEETLSLLEEVRFDSLFTFIFSPRVGTPAAKMDDPVPMEEKKKWFQRLLDTQNRISVEKHKEYIGRILPVLVEEENPADAVNNLNCRTDGWRLVHVPGDVSLLGQRKKVKITDCSTWSLFGEFVEE